MSIFSRMSNLFRAKANAAIDRMSDPAKEVELLIVEMEEQLGLARGETVKCKASEKLCAQRITTLEQEIAAWTARAEEALHAGDEPLAREALARRVQAEQSLGEARRELAEVSRDAARLAETLVQLEARLAQYRLRKGTIKAKATLGKRDLEAGTTDAFAEFDRMAGKVDENEVLVEAQRELTGEREHEAELSTRINALAAAPGSDDVAARLAALKEKIGKSE